ncbi:MAG: SDR family NAD(P)-dependent oxidoreductase [Prevotella sp.]
MRIIVMGATSGIGRAVAEIYLREGHIVGLCGRRLKKLEEMKSRYPDNAFISTVDVTADDATDALHALVSEIGGMDLYIHCSGYGKQTLLLDGEVEMQTADTNVLGFTRMLDWAYRYFADNSKRGHIAFISSIAGTKGLGASPSYSASKRYQWIYAEALAQMAKMNGHDIRFTDIRPGFVDTDFLNGGKYPLMLDVERVARSVASAIRSSKRVAVIDYRYRALCFFWRLIPSWLWIRLPIHS